MDAPDPISRATSLVRLFVPTASDFGTLRSVVAADVPQPYRDLLDHCSHMTVAMERFHGGPAGLRVVATADADRDDWYAREILLTSPRGDVVQYGIVRIDLSVLEPATAARVRRGDVPLGRILIESGVLCEVQRVRLLEVRPGPHLEPWLGRGRTYGRVAALVVDGQPTIELLEISAAVGDA